jgi:L-aminopeptidase/D-esterase-like protein
LKGLTDIPDFRAITGCTAILCEAGAVCGFDIRGSASATGNQKADVDTLSVAEARALAQPILRIVRTAKALGDIPGLAR